MNETTHNELRRIVLAHGLRPTLNLLAFVIEDLANNGTPVPYIPDEGFVDREDLATACDNLRESMF